MADLEKNILVVIPVNEDHKKFLEEKAASGNKNCCVRYVNGSDVTAEDVKEANVIIGNVDPALVKEAKNLELFQLNSAGADQYIKPGILPEQAVLANATGAYGLAVSEHMLALTFDLIRRFNQYHANQAKHVWQSMGNITSVEGSTILVLGLGDIGGDYARKCHALGAHVIGVRRTNRNKPDYLDEVFTTEHLDELLPRADFVALSLPNSPATYHIMDERRLRLMKKTAFLLNVGRGSAIDPEALNRVLHDGWLGGCGVDVTEPEPLPEDSPLWDAPRMYITPHISGQYHLQETFERIVRIAGGNLEKFLAGEKDSMKNLVDFKTGYRRR